MVEGFFEKEVEMIWKIIFSPVYKEFEAVCFWCAPSRPQPRETGKHESREFQTTFDCLDPFGFPIFRDQT